MRENTGERTPLVSSAGKRGSAIFIQSDTHVLARQQKQRRESSSPQQQQQQAAHHFRNSSNYTQISGGLTTNLSSGDKRMDALLEMNKRKRKNKHLPTQILIGTCYLVVCIYTLVIIIGPLRLSFMEESEWCPLYTSNDDDETRNLKSSGVVFNWDIPIQDREYDNPDFDQNPCHHIRIAQLCWLTMIECDMSRRMLTSVILGGAIGYERRTSDRPAGIRTMGLVSLGACFFTVSSIMAFRSSTMGWDASRVTAALPSGVGFLGAALIWKGKIGEEGDQVHQVHGLTTAASLWLSAAIGVGAGGALYFVSIYSTVLILLVLRFGPKFYLQPDEDSDDEDEEDEEDEQVTEHDLMTERWLAAQSTEQEESLSKEESALIQEASQVSFSRPSDLSYKSSTASSLRRNVAAPSERTIRRTKSRKSVYEAPTFHS